MQRQKSTIYWIAGILGAVLIITGLLRSFVLQPYIIPSPSMEPTLTAGDRILVNRFAYQFWAPSRGDVVVFAYPKDPKRTFVKRVVAVEGEMVELKDNQVFINGKLVNEPYLKEGDYPPFGPEAVPRDKVFVLGDNRRQSEDSREWGLLPKNYLIGKAWMIYYPLNRFKFF